MRRRSVLAALGTLAASTACLSRGVPNPAGVADREFTRGLDPAAVFGADAGGRLVEAIRERPAEIRFEPDPPRLVALGALYVGGSCHRAVLDSIAYDDGRFEAVVTHGETGGAFGGSCTDEMAPDYYRLAVTFADALPRVATVVERGRAETTEATARPGRD